MDPFMGTGNFNFGLDFLNSSFDSNEIYLEDDTDFQIHHLFDETINYVVEEELKTALNNCDE